MASVTDLQERRGEVEEEDGRQEEPKDPKRRDFLVYDREAGELTQLSLDAAIFEKYKVASTRISISGGDEFINVLLNQIVDGDLHPGAIVEVAARGHVKEYAPVIVKGHPEGKLIIVLDVLRTLQVTGSLTGKVESALNVDEEPKD